MKKLTIKTSLLCTASLLALTTSLQAQQDHLIENQRYVVGINDFSWGNTYVGKYTSGNGLVLREYIHTGGTNQITLNVSSLQIGSPTNSGNYVDLYRGGTLEIEEDFTINAPASGNRLTIHDQGTLFVKSDFDASMDGFFYNSGARLHAGGSVTNLDIVEGGLNFSLVGEDASWNFASSNLIIGGVSDANSVSISNNATVEIENILIGSAGTSSNGFIIADGGRAFVRNNITNMGAASYVRITNSGILAVDFDFDASQNNVALEKGGILEAHQNLIFHGITNGGGVILTGTNANWSNLSASTLQIGPSTDENNLLITDGAVVHAGGLQLGGASNINNNIYINNGGNLILGNIGSTVFETNTIEITQGGKLTLESDFDYGLIGGYFYWYDGGIVEAKGEAPIFGSWTINGEYRELGKLFLNNGKTLILNGPSARWSAFGDNLHIGDLSANNHLIATNGGQVFVNSASLGDFKEGGNNNSILITGTNSLLNSSSYVAIGGTVDSGNWIGGGTNNWITVENGGQLQVGTTLHNRNKTKTSGLNIKPGGLVTADNYYQASGASLNIFTDSSGMNAGLLSVTNTAEFETGAKVGFDAVAALTIGQTYTNLIVESGTLIVDGVTNATTADLDPLETTGGSLVNYDLEVQGQDIYATFTRRSIADGGGITDSMLTQISDEIDRLAGLGNSAASNQVAILTPMSGAQAKQEMEQLYSYQLPTYMHNQGIFGGIDQVRARSSSFRGSSSPAPATPAGAAGPGPHSGTQEFQPWVKVYGNYGSRDNDSDFDDGYDVQAYGTVLGIDKSFGSLLVGVAGGYAGSTITGDNDDESVANTAYGLIYGTMGTNDWFGDVVISYGLSDIENESGGAFDVESDVDASQTVLYFGGGKQFKDPDGSKALLRPMGGLQISFFDQDAYTEESTTAVAKDVDAYDRTSYLSTLGAALIFPVKGLKANYETEFRAYWLHEFNDDEDTIDYTLVGSAQPGQFVVRSPDADIGQFGIGFAADCNKSGLKLRADLDGQFSKTYNSVTLSGSLLYEF